MSAYRIIPRSARHADGSAPPSARRFQSAGRAAATEFARAPWPLRRGSISAMTIPGSVPPSAMIRPQGSTISEWPYVSRPFSCLPPCAAAKTKQPFSMARAAHKHVPMRFAGLFGECGGNRQHGGARFGQRAIERGETQVVTNWSVPGGPTADPPAPPAHRVGSFAIRDSSLRPARSTSNMWILS